MVITKRLDEVCVCLPVCLSVSLQWTLTCIFQVMRLDVSAIANPPVYGGVARGLVSAAMRVFYTPVQVNHLVVVTSNNKLLKFDAFTGKLVSEVR